MPHIRVLLNKEKTDLITWYQNNKFVIRSAFSDATGYSTNDIALIGELLDPSLCQNILDFELVILTGKKKWDEAESVSKHMIVSLRKAGIQKHTSKSGWGVWTKPNRITSYIEGR